MTRDAWLRAHAYLEPIGRFSAQVGEAAAGIPAPAPSMPCWDEYAGDLDEGIPLLKSANTDVDLEPGGAMAVALVGRLASGPLTGKLGAETRALAAELASEPRAPRLVADWLLGEDVLAPSSPGLLRYLGWTAMARFLVPVVGAFDAWRGEERWLRGNCPTCGALPAMAQLVGTDPGRKRFLACGYCGTRWRYGRTGCPFCESDTQRLASVVVEGEGMRIDSCESCRGYLKTYDGQGDEDLLLADWTSLHLDLVAQDRGLRRLAASLYELESAAAS
jgi:FdhE protein